MITKITNREEYKKVLEDYLAMLIDKGGYDDNNLAMRAMDKIIKDYEKEVERISSMIDNITTEEEYDKAVIEIKNNCNV